ncbi:Tsp1 domain-containing protein TSP12 (Precursor),related, related [Cryptosporidium felis]|nr:Tsp1 domain-containing protein TSP12 (Precursor),related, related [Cryptosporidium felis]
MNGAEVPKWLFLLILFRLALEVRCESSESPVSLKNMDEAVLRSRGGEEKAIDTLNLNQNSYQELDGIRPDLDKLFINSSELNNLLADINKESSSNVKGRKFQNENEFQRTVIFQVEENNRFVDSDIDIFVSLTLPFSTFEGHKIDYFIISTPPSYTLPKTEKVCECIKHYQELNMGEMKQIPLNIKCTTVSANGSIYFVIQSRDENPFEAPGYFMFHLRARTPIETHKVQNDPKNFWWLSKIRFSSGHYITKVHENSRLLLKAECQWGPWRRETGCSSTCNSGIEIWRRTLLSGKDEDLCGGVYQKRECGTTPCDVSCQLGPWEELIPCTVNCSASKSGGKRIEYRKILLMNSGNGPDCEELYPWDDEKKEGWNKSLGMVVRFTECPLEMRRNCNQDLGCRVERENLRTIASEYPWGYCPFPCGGFGNITSIVQVAHGIPKWVGEKLYPDTFEYPCVSNKKPIVEYKPCNTEPCGDCMVYLEDSVLNKTTNIWIFFHLFQEADEIRLVLPDGFTFIRSDESELIHGIGVNKSNAKMIDSIKTAIENTNEINFVEMFKGLFGQSESSSPNKTTTLLPNGKIENEVQNEKNVIKCQVTAASFGSIKACQLKSSKHSEEGGLKEALIILDSTVQPTRSIFSQQSKNEKPNWLFMPLKIGNAEGLVLPDGKLNKEQFKLYTRGSNSLKEPEELVCNLQSKALLPQPCKVDLLPKNPNDCLKCSKTNHFEILAYRQFTHSKNGGACAVPAEFRIDEAITKINCVNVCPNGKRYIMGTEKYLGRIGIKHK